MLECTDIIKNNKMIKLKTIPRLEKGGVVRLVFNGNLDSHKLKKLFSEINFIFEIYKKGCRKIIFVCQGVFAPSDKFAYTMLECLLYTLKYQCGYEVELDIGEVRTTVHTPGLRDSLLNDFANSALDDERIRKRYKKIFTPNHFREIIEAKDIGKISLLLGDLKIFFRVFDFCSSYGAEIAKVVSELADNATEHTGSDCLVDIFVSDPTYKKKGDENDYYVVSIVVLNFSKQHLGDDVKKKILERDYSSSSRYDLVCDAYNNHKSFFDKTNGYNEEDFFNIVSFQNQISGRRKESETGGTGLTSLIKSLEDKAEAHSCYVLSGKQGLWFEPEYLGYNTDDWIGFNENNDFITQMPQKDLLVRSAVDFLGTGYNFTLVIKKECRHGN